MSLTIGTVNTSLTTPHIASIEAIVIRCICGHPELHPGEVCPIGHVEPYGVIAYTNSSNILPPRSRVARAVQRLKSFIQFFTS